jgi:hypothetical protein
MSGNKLIIGSILVTLAVIIGGVALISKTGPAELAVSQEVHAQAPQTSHDWGEIPINDGNVNKTFEIKNDGPGVLELANVSTSCMCTTAQVIINGDKSPFFGMHAKSSWQGQIPAGESAQVFIEFDPAFHGPNGVGQISRQISLETNDPDNPKITFNLTGNVIN